MTTQPIAALRVADLATSVAFYTERLGFALGEQHPEADRAVCFNPLATDGNAFLLAGPRAEDVTPYLSGPRIVLEPGEQPIRFFREDLETVRAAFAERGVSDLEIIESPWERSLSVTDPDGYILSFVTLKELTSEETLERYANCPDELETTVSGLSEEDLELSSAPGAWSIRQMVHHIADGDDLWCMAIKAALARSGFHYSHDWYTTDNAIAEPLDYAGRAIEPSLALFRAHRAHIAQLMRHLPDAWERYIFFRWPNTEAEEQITASTMIRWQARHAEEHIEAIRRILQQHGR
jgi:catechol 2,3-dioxygenase-like lactoylglutathione lyase family enzyme